MTPSEVWIPLVSRYVRRRSERALPRGRFERNGRGVYEPSAPLLLGVLIAVLAVTGACSGETGASDDGAADTGADIAPIDDAGRDSEVPGDADSGAEVDAADTAADAAPSGCDSADDCAPGQICVDLLPGPANGFCTTRCVDDSQCEEGFDCVIIGDDELSYQACIDVDFCLDGDLDGYGLGPGCPAADCDDTEPRIHPGADELCNATDDNCDGIVDNNTVESGDDCDTGYLGVCGEGRIACVSGLTECRPRVSSSAEICDGRDNDCDGVVDEDAADATTWWVDADGDRFGDEAQPVVACTRPAGTVDVAGDCDDTARAINPGATEVCDGVDNDCDGIVDGPDTAGTMSLWADADGDGYGDPATPRTGCIGPGWVGNSRDCNDRDPAINPDATEVCDGVDNDCNSVVDDGSGPDAGLWYRDFDGDGFGDARDAVYACNPVEGRAPNAEDCNDRNAAVNPDAVEVCDGIDNNCVDGVDERVTTRFWRDLDGDGRGDPTSYVEACSAPSGYVANANDCNDGEREAWTGRTEVCDGIDNNCTGGIDEGVTNTYWRDADGDGYGDLSMPIQACSLPPGYASNPNDCNDLSNRAHPGGTEVCDGLDNDCVGGVDNGVGTTWYRDEDGDGYGSSITVVSCTQPARTATRGGDCNDALAAVNPGAVELCSTPYDDNCNGSINEASAADAPIWYMDSDRDGQGAPTPIYISPFAVRSCTQPIVCIGVVLPPFNVCIGEIMHYSANDLDCDDSSARAQFRPGYPEVSDGYDNDCNGTRDDGLCSPRNTYYYDGDGDGYGSTRSITACVRPVDAPSRWVSVCCDRDDENSGIW